MVSDWFGLIAGPASTQSPFHHKAFIQTSAFKVQHSNSAFKFSNRNQQPQSATTIQQSQITNHNLENSKIRPSPLRIPAGFGASLLQLVANTITPPHLPVQASQRDQP
jgi:hypothetical protein